MKRDDNARSQPDKFRDLAKSLECDDDEKTFEEKVRRVAKAPPPPSEPLAD